MGPKEQNKDNKTPWLIIVVWSLIAIVCFQGYWFLFKKPAQKPMPVKPVSRPVVVKPGVPKSVQGRIAIVLDDWGFNRVHCKYLKAFPVPVAPAVMPNLPYSSDVIKCAIASGQEPILHLPLEPHANNDSYPRGYILTTWMSQKEILKLLTRILDEYPGVVGVNNHMGSKATEDKKLMTTILTELNKRGLFFVDSVTSVHSVCPEVAKAIGIPFTKREVFLDNSNERIAIERKFAEGVRIAHDKGFVLMIGHDRELTLKIVDEQIRKYKQQGYEFLSLKDFIKAERQ